MPKTTQQQFNAANYYSSAYGKTGKELKLALNQIIKGHTRYNYKCIWEILKYADEDPDNSDNVILIYTRRSVPKSDKDSGQNDPDSWNREHVWAKSHGFPKEKQHAYTDAHHIRPADRSINTSRNNREFDDDGDAQGECLDCGRDKNSWYPGDGVRGDVARMMFYMAVRYEGYDSNTPDLELVDNITKQPSGVPQNEKFGKLCTLYLWHLQDPVSEIETRRNSRIYEWQENRNPFIDHPEWVSAIWGKACLCQVE